MIRIAIVILLAVFICIVRAGGDQITLSVSIDGAKADTGQIYTSLFNSEKTYMKTPIAKKIVDVDSEGKAVVMFENLTAGEYAVSIIYDENKDGKFNTNLLGIPEDKVGFSNNAKSYMGPVPYKKARFILDSENTAIKIMLGKIN